MINKIEEVNLTLFRSSCLENSSMWSGKSDSISLILLNRIINMIKDKGEP